MKEKNKNIILSFRVTPEEKTWIEEHSYGHYRRISDFVRDCIFKSRVQESCGRKYRVNSIFPHAAGRDLDDNIRHLLGREIDNVS